MRYSATDSERSKVLTSGLQQRPLKVVLERPTDQGSLIEQRIITTDKKLKTELLLELLNQPAHQSMAALIFVRTKRTANQLRTALAEKGKAVAALHGERTQAQRFEAWEMFQGQKVQYLIATDVAARGLDINGLPLVVNYDLPDQAEDYTHRIGRTGRAGQSGLAISLVCADEAEQLLAIEREQNRLFKRTEVLGFVAEHRVPDTDLRQGVLSKQRKKVTTKSVTSNEPLVEKPKVNSVRKAPSFLTKAGKKGKV